MKHIGEILYLKTFSENVWSISITTSSLKNSRKLCREFFGLRLHSIFFFFLNKFGKNNQPQICCCEFDYLTLHKLLRKAEFYFVACRKTP